MTSDFDISTQFEGIKEFIASEMAKWKVDLEASISNMVSTLLQPIKDDITSLRESVSFINSKYDEFNNKVIGLEKELKSLSSLSIELSTLKKKIDTLETENNSREQWSRRSNIEVYGIPERKNENLMEILKTISDRTGYQLNPSTDIDFVTRVAHSKSENRLIKPIVIKFLSRWKKDDFLALAKRIKLQCSDIGFAGNSSNVYFKEHLTRSNKALLQEAKKLAKEKNFSYVWIKNCTIMVRRTDTSPVLHILSNSDLKKIV
ncbi:uncharacterized protein LOC123669739 [Melitaea cinxia]|uniref:uncharacterized protein LOC123669739 n=1 Tax=Melitaea cinxia TaxID=113334 RepID=UPI001E274525|nr:uncharacterized protein LOC123669739 [Melitaea cinxia]